MFSVKIYFPTHFSMMQNMNFLDHVADAKFIYFEKVVYAVCSDVTTAESICTSFSGSLKQKLSVHRVQRLGPAFCSFKNKTPDPSVLTIRKLPPNLTYMKMKARFPTASDICLKKTMAKIKFADSEDCQDVFIRTKQLVWPDGARPKYTCDQCDDECDDETPLQDPELMLYGHPSRFVTNPNVVALSFKQNFDIKKNMNLLNMIKNAKDIVLSKSCTVSFNSAEEAQKRRQMLQELTVMGGKLVAWLPQQGHDSSLPLKQNNQQKRRNESDDLSEENSEESDSEEKPLKIAKKQKTVAATQRSKKKKTV